MSYTVEKEFRFEAAHRLPDHDGKCARLHGHSFRAFVRVTAPRLVTEGPKRGMVVDFGQLSAIVKPIVEEKLDHHFLNESVPLENPTSEHLARWLWLQVAARLMPGRAHRGFELAVVIEETCTSRCTFVGAASDFEEAAELTRKLEAEAQAPTDLGFYAEHGAQP